MGNQTDARLAALRTKMRETGTGLLAIAPGSYMEWLLGFHPHPDERPCLLLIGGEKAAFLMPALNAEGTRADTDIAFFSWSDADGPQAALKEALAAIDASDPGRVALDETMRADFALLLLDALPDVKRDFTHATLGALRMRKDGEEYRRLKSNAEICDRAMQTAFAKIRPGMTEKELAADIRAHFSSEGASPAFWIVGSGPNGAFPHHSASDQIIAEGDAVVIDIGGRSLGFPSDMTRMAVVGMPPEGYGEKVIADAGYGDYFVHRTGHGLGIDIHEPPYITSTSDTVLEEGMVFSIEPGIYLPGRFGIRLEDIVILRAEGPEILSSLPRDAYFARI
jgi:Xaa-Pro aminopeptidase